jgi:ferredoxin
MFGKRAKDKLEGATGTVKVIPSRCLRMRFNKSTCSTCLECCPGEAITLEGGLAVKEDSCTGCMLCASDCPSDALQAEAFSLLGAVAALKKVRSPVLGCSVAGNTPAHERAPCLGLLSEEHLIALAILIDAPIQLNLTGCAGCVNGPIVAVLRERAKSVAQMTTVDTGKVILVEKEKDLSFDDIHYDRRGFFRAFRNLSIRGTSAVIGGLSDNKPTVSFAQKTLPIKRMLLNSVLSSGAGEVHRKAILLHYYYDLSVDETCNLCFACAGACPSGAITMERDRPGDGVMFNPSLCSGCGLCAGFCMLGSITINKGFKGDDFSGFRTVGGAQESGEED